MDQKMYNQFEEIVQRAIKGLASKEDLRAELKVQRNSIVEEIAENINNFMQEVEEKKADREDVEALEKQVDRLERKIFQ